MALYLMLITLEVEADDEDQAICEVADTVGNPSMVIEAINQIEVIDLEPEGVT